MLLYIFPKHHWVRLRALEKACSRSMLLFLMWNTLMAGQRSTKEQLLLTPSQLKEVLECRPLVV